MKNEEVFEMMQKVKKALDKMEEAADKFEDKDFGRGYWFAVTQIKDMFFVEVI